MVYVLLADGFEEIEAVTPVDILRRGEAETKFVSVSDVQIEHAKGRLVRPFGSLRTRNLFVTGARGITVKADLALETLDLKRGDHIIVPGGMRGVENLEAMPNVLKLLAHASDRGISLCAICAGPRVLAKAGVFSETEITCYPGLENEMQGAVCRPEAEVVKNKGVITARAAGSAVDFGLAILEDIKGGPAAEKVRKAIVYDS
ncbi:MAG: DJ-1/PfpI family protein [Oscillospiraceae bacterium]|nr:DJ-1/PfpI family protein [Oscillospiraceae bacterium]